MVVVAIVGVLSAVALPQLTAAQDKAKRLLLLLKLSLTLVRNAPWMSCNWWNCPYFRCRRCCKRSGWEYIDFDEDLEILAADNDHRWCVGTFNRYQRHSISCNGESLMNYSSSLSRTINHGYSDAYVGPNGDHSYDCC